MCIFISGIHTRATSFQLIIGSPLHSSSLFLSSILEIPSPIKTINWWPFAPALHIKNLQGISNYPANVHSRLEDPCRRFVHFGYGPLLTQDFVVHRPRYYFDDFAATSMNVHPDISLFFARGLVSLGLCRTCHMSLASDENVLYSVCSIDMILLMGRFSAYYNSGQVYTL